MQSIPYAFPHSTPEQIESESRAASFIRTSLEDRGVGVVAPASNDVKHQHRKVIPAAFDENNQRNQFENSMNLEQRGSTRPHHQLGVESRIQRTLVDDLRDAKNSFSSSSSIEKLEIRPRRSPQEQKERENAMNNMQRRLYEEREIGRAHV